MNTTTSDERLLVHLASYNTNVQPDHALPNDLADWLQAVQHTARPADIIAIGFQELLPLHLAFIGWADPALNKWDELVRAELEAHAPGTRYTLLAKPVNVNVALLVYARDEGIARRVTDLTTAWTGCGLGGWMGNKGAVGVRFRVSPAKVDGGASEVFTFVSAHLAAHDRNFNARIRDWNRIVGTLLFPSPPSQEGNSSPTTLYNTSHLFVVGDFNFRVVLPGDHPHFGPTRRDELISSMESEEGRERVKEHDQLRVAHQDARVFVGLREGEYWRFKCTYKHKIGHVDNYSSKRRTPSWTDRILYTTFTDKSDKPFESNVENLVYTSLPSYINSDHKPVVALLSLPASPPTTPDVPPPVLRLPDYYKPIPYRFATLTRRVGRAFDRATGLLLCLITLIGTGSTALGITSCFVSLGAWTWWSWRARTAAGNSTLSV